MLQPDFDPVSAAVRIDRCGYVSRCKTLRCDKHASLLAEKIDTAGRTSAKSNCAHCTAESLSSAGGIAVSTSPTDATNSGNEERMLALERVQHDRAPNLYGRWGFTKSMPMNPRHAAELAIVILIALTIAPGSSLAATEKSKFSTYTNQTYGFSFQYPSEWTLKEGDRVKLSWGYLGPVEPALPHGIAVAALVIPYKPHFVSVTVDTTVTDIECNRSVFSGLEDAQPEPGKFPTVKVGENQFTAAIQKNGGLSHQAFAQYYHVFENRVCYEFELGVVGSDEMTENKKNEEFRVLKAILATVKFYATTVAPHRLKSFIHHLETERSGPR